MRGLEQIPWLYDGLMGVADLLGVARWRRELVAGAAGRVLEVGCGTGRNLPLYPDAADLVGVDPNPAALARARRRAPRARLVVGRVESLPFETDAFDTVVTSLVFCSVDDPLRGLAEIRRVLRTGGQLRMLEHVRARGRRLAALQDRIAPLWTRLTGGCRPNRDIEHLVQQAGFRIEQHWTDATHLIRRFAAVAESR